MKTKTKPIQRKTEPNDSNPCDYCACEILFDEESTWNENKWFHTDCFEVKNMIGEIKPNGNEPDFLVIESVKVIYN